MPSIRLTAAALLAATALCSTQGVVPARAASPKAVPTAAPAGTANPADQAKSSQPAQNQAGKDQAAKDPVLAKVGDADIHQSDVQDMMKSLPPQLQAMPPQVLTPMVLDRLIDERAVVVMARKQGLDKDPQVEHRMKMAADQALENALLARAVGPQITEQAIRAVYDRDYANKPGEGEVHARHILVGSEDEAKKIIAELKKGADFAKLAQEHSTDPGSKQDGGDLGFFKKTDMVPAFADAAFAMKDGEISPQPVHTQFGWHVIQVMGHRNAPPVPFEQAQSQIREKLIQQGVTKVVQEAKAGVKVQKFNPDGTPQKPTDNAEPPPAMAPAPSPAPSH